MESHSTTDEDKHINSFDHLMAIGKYLDHIVRCAHAHAHHYGPIICIDNVATGLLLFLRSHEWNEKASNGYLTFESKCCCRWSDVAAAAITAAWARRLSVSIDRVLLFIPILLQLPIY